jgi:hypothetical protein
MLRLQPQVFVDGPDAWNRSMEARPEQVHKFEMPAGSKQVLHVKTKAHTMAPLPTPIQPLTQGLTDANLVTIHRVNVH